MKLRYGILILVLALTAFALAACGGGSGGSSVPANRAILGTSGNGNAALPPASPPEATKAPGVLDSGGEPEGTEESSGAPDNDAVEEEVEDNGGADDVDGAPDGTPDNDAVEEEVDQTGENS